MLISFLVFSIFVSVRYFIKLNNELEQKKIRANCGINFNRLANLISQDRDNKTKKISDIIKSNDKIFIPISNIRFEDLLVVHHDLLRINILNPILLISDKPWVHKDGRRHVLMSDGNVYFLSSETFDKLLKTGIIVNE